MTPEELGFSGPSDFLDFCEANASSDPAILTGAQAACLCGMAGRDDLASNFVGNMHQIFGFAATRIVELVAAARDPLDGSGKSEEDPMADQEGVHAPVSTQGATEDPVEDRP
jgi:hypothetical protein